MTSLIPEHQNQEAYRFCRDLPELLEGLGFHGISPMATTEIRSRHPVTVLQRRAIRECVKYGHYWGVR